MFSSTHAGRAVQVEYPKRLAHEIPDTLCGPVEGKHCPVATCVACYNAVLRCSAQTALHTPTSFALSSTFPPQHPVVLSWHRHLMPRRNASLQVRDRKYGRTFLALYAPTADDGDSGESDEYWQAY